MCVGVYYIVVFVLVIEFFGICYWGIVGVLVWFGIFLVIIVLLGCVYVIRNWRFFIIVIGVFGILFVVGYL